MGCFEDLRRRKPCQLNTKHWVFISITGFLVVLGLGILISSVSYLHKYDKDCDNSSPEIPKESVPEALTSQVMVTERMKSILSGPCSSTDSCPFGAVCEEGICSCNETYLNYKDVCHKVTNLALEKTVSASSSLFPANNKRWENAVDGRTHVMNFNLLFHTGYEIFPWLSINLGTELCVVKSIILFNRIDNHGRWLHDVEARVGNSSNWPQMSTCGTFIGPSKTGDVHIIECGTLLYGKCVTVKIVKPNYITDDRAARGGKNALVLEEVVVNGIVL
ncbi:uncharacterized protein LOC133187969 [Saccostrea echinata]|uniref:uncharacterized protein LOC133187969 n=1 Tax=Saccostrea echinata TaxID=191078 RepID=UPI002A82A42A|nr:uncharacterized protein LOC133187969 [Saccostrea echinata]